MATKKSTTRLIVNCVVVVSVFGIILRINTELRAQSTTESQRPFTFYSLRLADGGFDIHTMRLSTYDDYGEETRLLRNPAFQDELELTDKQSSTLNAEIELFTARIKDIKKMPPALSSKPSDSFTQRLGRTVQEFKETLNSVLLPHQIQRINELNVRFEIRREGIRQTLESKRIANKLNISDEQRLKLRKKSHEIGTDLAQRAKKLRAEFFEKMVNSLPSKKREEFMATFAKFYEKRVPALDAIVWQEENAEALHDLIVEQSISEEIYCGLFLPSIYEVDAAGCLVGPTHSDANSFVGSDQGRKESLRIKKYLCCQALLIYLNEPQLIESLEITNKQLEMIDSVRAMFEASKDRLMSRRTKAWEQGRLNEIRDLEISERAENGSQGLREIDRILLPHQKQSLQLVAEGAEFVLGGFSYAIEFGIAGERIKLEHVDKKKVKETSQAFIKKAVSETRDWEQNGIDRLLEVLEPEQREKFETMVGSPLKYTGCSIELFIAQLLSFND